jgi:hypothetical protein
MPEPISVAFTLVGYAALYGYGRNNTALSSEAKSANKAVAALIESKERSQSLFGVKASVIAAIRSVAAEACEDDWDAYGSLGVDPLAVWNAEEFIRALPDDFPMPEVAAEPDGSISLDWIQSRNRVFSVSVGTTNRLAFAWLDGTERGHSVVNFDGSNLPQHLVSQIGPIVNYAPTPFRFA